MSGDAAIPTPADAQPSTSSAEWLAPPASDASELLESHPEVLAGAAFVGGLFAALIVRRLGR